MNRKSLVVSSCIACVGVAALVGSVATAQSSGDPMKKRPGAGGHGEMPKMEMPPGWTEADMQACMEAGTPGAMHKELMRHVGEWKGTATMWMYPGSEATQSECSASITPIMDGRFTRCDWKGEMMGPFNGMGISGYDNVSKELIATWIDNHSTGMAQATGELSSDKKTITWDFSYNCPVTKKASKMREVDTMIDDNTMKIEMFMTDPKSGKEFKMMSVDFKKQG